MDSARRCEERRLEQLAGQKGVTVLEYAHSEPERRATPEICCRYARDVLLLRRRDYAALSKEDAGAAIVKSSEALAVFSRTHPRVFANMLDENVGPGALQMLERFARIRAQGEATGATEEEMLVHANRLIMEKTMRAPTEEEKGSLKLQPA